MRKKTIKNYSEKQTKIILGKQIEVVLLNRFVVSLSTHNLVFNWEVYKTTPSYYDPQEIRVCKDSKVSDDTVHAKFRRKGGRKSKHSWTSYTLSIIKIKSTVIKELFGFLSVLVVKKCLSMKQNKMQ